MMSQYASEQFVRPNPGAPEFNAAYKPGDPAPFSGIYRCIYCGLEATSEVGNQLPTQHDQVHNNTWLPIQWRLIVKAAHSR
jgi:hypothetical protein